MSQLSVNIMGQPYTLSCKEGEEAALQEAVKYLDGKMSSIRDAGKIRGNDRIAVIAALGIAAELLATKSPVGPLADLTVSEVNQQIAAMHDVLDEALAAQEALF
ncbi:cell division ZapA family protein [Collimonas arenae]|uniref:Cell division protein ZapA n=1 Tax=Collimonas arenae TaxID=279058 RepID=A0A127PLZ5_9BURK|nr:cell division protein ZapA [Collimonas arenae]AMO98785.1 cell division ZapA family protein [Collimonas arenae]AMP08679.1 cell division ZapA family protein [Collimonas arenae]